MGSQGVHVSEGPMSFASAASAPESPCEIHVYTGSWLSPLIITNCFRKPLLCGENCSQGLFRAPKCLAVFEGQLLLC